MMFLDIPGHLNLKNSVNVCIWSQLMWFNGCRTLVGRLRFVSHKRMYENILFTYNF